MKALILCAGLGTRLKPITNSIPKCMVEVGGKPVLEHLVEHLEGYGVRNVVVNLHLFPEKVYGYFGTRLLYLYEPRPLGEEKTEQKLREWLGERYLVMNGDTLTNIDVSELIEDSNHMGSVMSWDTGLNVYTGIKIHDAKDVGRPQHVDYGCYWKDIGTKEGLLEARELYEKLGHLPEL